MNQLTENKTNAKAVTVIFSVLAILGGAAFLVTLLFSDIRNIFQYHLSFINIIFTLIYRLEALGARIILPLLLILYAAIFHKKGKATFLVPAIFGLITLDVLVFDFIMPVVQYLFNLLFYQSVGVKGILFTILFGADGNILSLLIDRAFEIVTLIGFGVTTIMAFTGLKSKTTSNIFKVSLIVGSLASVFGALVSFLLSVIQAFIMFEKLNISLLWNYLVRFLSVGSLIAFFLALVIFFMANKLPQKQKNPLPNEV